MSDAHEEFDELVNMAPKELEDFLETEESRSVGQTDAGSSPASSATSPKADPTTTSSIPGGATA